MELKDIVLKEGDIVYFKNEVWCVNHKESNKKFGEVFEEDGFIKIERPVKYETIYEAPKEILDKEEKEYLEAVIRPFRDRVLFISKYSCVEGYEYICIAIKDDNWTTLPDFESGTMYKGMELNKEYTLDELGLFKE